MKALDLRHTLVEGKGHLDHPEDLVFTQGSTGAKQALKSEVATVKDPNAITIKWDGYPALIFGRDGRGRFSITDKHMFNKAGGAGRVHSPEEFIEYDRARGADRSELTSIITQIWPVLERETPGKGYYWGDFLFKKPLEEKNGVYTFRANPNGITYTVDASSDIGKIIKGKQAGIAVHQYLPPEALTTDEAVSLDGTIGQLKNNSSIAIVPSKMPVTPTLKANKVLVDDAKRAIAAHGAQLDQLLQAPAGTKSKFNPNLFTVYINKRIVDGNIGNVAELVRGFNEYYKTRSADWSPSIKQKVDAHLRANQKALRGAFTIWATIYNLKDNIYKQIAKAAENSPVKGYLEDGTQTQEGFVANNIKFVDRMGFSRQNLQARNTKPQDANAPRRVFVVFGGGFQPWSPWHTASYEAAKQAFPDAEFYIATSNNTRERPLPYNEKGFLIKQAGVADPIVNVKTPLNPREIMANFDPERDVFILVRSAKDPVPYTKQDGTPGYYQPITSLKSLDAAQPFGKNGYVFVPPIKQVKLLGKTVNSATTVRNWYRKLDRAGRVDLIIAMYPNATSISAIKNIFDDYFAAPEPDTMVAEDEAAQFNQPQNSLGAMPGIQWTQEDEARLRQKQAARSRKKQLKFMGKLNEADPPMLSYAQTSAMGSYPPDMDWVTNPPDKRAVAKRAQKRHSAIQDLVGHQIEEGDTVGFDGDIGSNSPIRGTPKDLRKKPSIAQTLKRIHKHRELESFLGHKTIAYEQESPQSIQSNNGGLGDPGPLTQAATELRPDYFKAEKKAEAEKQRRIMDFMDW